MLLAGLTVIELGTLIAGPLCTRIMAEFGAEAIKAGAPDGKAFGIPGIVQKLSETRGATDWLGPAPGAHADEILAALGDDAATIAGLRAAGAI